MERLVRTDLPRESAFWAATAALCFQVAFRLSRLELEVFFLGVAMTEGTEIFHSLTILAAELKNCEGFVDR